VTWIESSQTSELPTAAPVADASRCDRAGARPDKIPAPALRADSLPRKQHGALPRDFRQPLARPGPSAFSPLLETVCRAPRPEEAAHAVGAAAQESSFHRCPDMPPVLGADDRFGHHHGPKRSQEDPRAPGPAFERSAPRAFPLRAARGAGGDVRGVGGGRGKPVRGGIRRGRTEISNLSTLSALTPGGVPGEARPGGKFRRSESPLSTGKHPAAAPSRPAFPY
jgi:hypothetical protein